MFAQFKIPTLAFGRSSESSSAFSKEARAALRGGDRPSYIGIPVAMSYSNCNTITLFAFFFLFSFSVNLSFVHAATTTDSFILGLPGHSCYDTCLQTKRNCRSDVQHTSSLLHEWLQQQQPLLSECSETSSELQHKATQPHVRMNNNNKNNNKTCIEANLPEVSMCSASRAHIQRLCLCSSPSSSSSSYIGTALSQFEVDGRKETTVFAYTLEASDYGVMNHFWLTAGNSLTPMAVEKAHVRYYIDGETTASIAFKPSLAAGVGFEDQQAPWGTKWIGKGSRDGGWYFNLKIPFQRSIKVTVSMTGKAATPNMYMILRGALNQTLNWGGMNIPSVAKMTLVKVEGVTLQPLEYIDLIKLPAGTHGAHLMTTLQVSSANKNFLEGCIRCFSPPDQPWPGTVLSSGTEDYFDSAWYFDAGEFAFENAGLTHFNTSAGETQNGVEFSAYRLHEQDPLVFQDGYRYQWRNGDAADLSTLQKCYIQKGGEPVGHPQISIVTSYSWLYTW